VVTATGAVPLGNESSIGDNAMDWASYRFVVYTGLLGIVATAVSLHSVVLANKARSAGKNMIVPRLTGRRTMESQAEVTMVDMAVMDGKSPGWRVPRAQQASGPSPSASATVVSSEAASSGAHGSVSQTVVQQVLPTRSGTSSLLVQISNLPPADRPILPSGPRTAKAATTFYGGHSVGQLKGVLRSRALPENGMKADLISRLLRNDRSMGYILDNYYVAMC